MKGGTSPNARVPRPKIGVFWDLENLVSDYCKQELWSNAAKIVKKPLEELSLRGEIVANIACCDRSLARDLGPKLEPAGVTFIAHNGGPQTADRLLLEHIRRASTGCDIIVIGSGDGFFTEEAQRLRNKNKRIEVIYRQMKISAELYKVAHAHHVLP